MREGEREREYLKTKPTKSDQKPRTI